MTTNGALLFRCTTCSATGLSWVEEVGARHCYYHPGAVEFVPGVGRQWRRFTCCGHYPELVDIAPRQAAARGILPREATRGCTPCDHLSAWDAVDEPVFVLEGVLPRRPSSAQVAEPDEYAHMRDLVFISKIFWAKYAPAPAVAELATQRAMRNALSDDLLAIKTWLPYQSSVYDKSDANDNDGDAISDPTGARQEAAMLAQKDRLQRLACGLDADRLPDADDALRVASLGKGKDTLTFPMLKVSRADPPPSLEKRMQVANSVGQLFLYHFHEGTPRQRSPGH